MKRLIGVCILIFLVRSVAAQSPFFQPYYLLKKNEPVKVNKILQDKTGFIWFGTDKGLFKFDGINYRRFLGIDNLPDENVTALAQDSIGRLWVGFKNGKIAVVEKNTITPFEPAEGLPTKQISDILFDKEGVLWFSTYDDGIYYFFNSRLYRLDDIDGMPDLYAYDLEEDEQGNIWAGTDGGVAVCTRKGNSVEIKVINYSNGLPDNIIKKISNAKDNTVLLATEDAGLICFDNTTLKMKPLLNAKWRYGSITDFFIDSDWMWVATAQGLVSIDLSDQLQSSKIQSTDQVVALVGDREGSLWIGSKTGVMRTLGKQLQFLDVDGDQNVVALTIGSEGDIWYSTSQGLFKRKKEGALSRPLSGTAFASKSVISLFTDDEGFVWAGLYGEGALRIDPLTYSIRIFNKELHNGSVLNISGKNKSVWLATLGGATEIKIDKNFSVKNYDQSNGLSTDYIYQVFTDSQDRVWFATDRNGVDMLDANGFHNFKENLTSKVVYGFAEDSLHRVWTNVQNSGLYIFEGKKFEQFENQGRLHNINFNVFASSNRGQLLVAHDLGIDVFKGTENRFHYFDEEMGIRSKVANLNAVAKNKNGEIFIGTDHGIIIYDVGENKTQDFPTPYINTFQVDDQLIDLQTSDQLRYDQNNIKIGFIGFWYKNPMALRFTYQLENYDRDWITTQDQLVTYSKLPPGDYTFRVKVSETNDFSSGVETKIHFVVNPPFWRTTWFYISVILISGFIGYSVMRYRERKLVRDKRELEEKVKARTEEIEAKTHEIQAQAEEIKGINENLEALVQERTAELERKNKALADTAFINAHELRAPVASILGLINLMQKLKLSDDEKIYLEHLRQSAKKLDAVVSSITQAIERADFAKPSEKDE